ncbi:MAG: hypothetical protein V1716_00440 [Candidatus Uhrbacteria bacterium]
MHIQISGFPRSNESQFFKPGSSPDSLLRCLYDACLETGLFSESEVGVSFGRPRDGFDATNLLIKVFGLVRGIQDEAMFRLFEIAFSKAAGQHLAAPESKGRFPWEVTVTFHEGECFDVA